MSRILFLCFLFFIGFRSFCQKLSKIPVFSLGSTELDSTDSWLENAFGKVITDDYQFIGLGEFSHGGKETTTVKTKLVKYLVERKGYRSILLEYPNVQLNSLNIYLLKNSSASLDSVKIIAREIFARTFLQNSSFYELLIYIKAYNLQNADKPILLRGFDISGASSSFSKYFMKEYLERLDTESSVLIKQRFRNSPTDSLINAEFKWLTSHQNLLKSKLNIQNIQILNYDIKNAKDDLANLLMQKTNPYKASAFRDSIMADNVANKNSLKSIIWAQNGHLTTSDYSVSMGNYLNKNYKESKIYNILTDFSGFATLWCIENRNLLKKEFYPNKKTIASEIRNKRDINQGIVFFNDLKPKYLKFSNIGREGSTAVLGAGKPFDALIILNNVVPFEFN